MKPPYYEITMPDDSLWGVPLDLIARHRAEHYKAEFGDDVERSLAEDTMPLFREDPDEAVDWASNNMNWDDVEESAELIRQGGEIDFQEGWVNGPKKVVWPD